MSQHAKRFVIPTLAGLATAFVSASAAAERPPLAEELKRAVSIFEGEVIDAREEFDERMGPTTVYTIASIDTILGMDLPDSMDLAMFGGALPNGRHIQEAHTPRLFLGTRYVLALKAGTWRFSPVVESFVFRVEQDDSGADVLVTSEGRLVVAAGIDERSTSDPIIDVPRGDNLYPFEPPPIRDDGKPLLASGLDKHEFLLLVSSVVADYPLPPPQPTRRVDRPWNSAATSKPAESEQLECRGFEHDLVDVSIDPMTCDGDAE